jgi:hypothetical protein
VTLYEGWPFLRGGDLVVLLKSGFKRKVVSPEGDNLVVFYYLNTSEIWSDKRETDV